MALSQGILKLAIVEDRDASVPSYTFTDTTDYTGNGVTLADVKAAIKIEVDGVTYYDNLANISTAPDIDGSSAGQANEDLTRARTTTIPIQLPTITGSTAFAQGEIKVTYSVVEGFAPAFTNVITIDNSFTLPTGQLDTSLDLTPTSPLITVTDVTSYVVNNVTPTTARTLTLYYPSSTGEAASTTSSTELTTQRFYTGQQQATLSAINTWDYSARTVSGTTNSWTATFFSYSLNDAVTADAYINVESDTSICDVFCCISEFYDRIQLATGDAKQRMLQKQALIGSYLTFISAAFSCSKTSDVNAWVQDIKNLADCKGDCSCSDGNPTLIVPITGSSVSVGRILNFTTTSGQLTYQANDLINKVYTSSQNDFILWLDNVQDTASFVSSTGTITFSVGQPAGVIGKILILK